MRLTVLVHGFSGLNHLFTTTWPGVFWSIAEWKIPVFFISADAVYEYKEI